MPRPVRVLLLVVGIGATLVIIGVILLAVFFPTDRVTDLVVERIEAATGRDVTVRNAELSLFPSIRLEVDGLELRGPLTPRSPQITVDRLSARVRLRPLLARRVEITSVVVERPQVAIMLDQTPEGLEGGAAGRPRGAGTRGHFVGDPGAATDTSTIETTPPSGRREAAPTTDPPASETTELPLAIDIEQLEVHDANIVLLLPGGRRFVELIGLDETLEARASPNGDLSLDATTRLEELRAHLPTGTFGEGLALSLHTSLRYDAADDALVVRAAVLDLAGLDVRVSGRVDRVRTERIADLRFEGGPARVEEIVGLLPRDLFPEVEGMSSSGNLQATGFVKGSVADPDGPDFELAVSLRDGRIEYPGMSRPVEDVRLAVHAKPDAIHITALEARTGSSRFSASAHVREYRTTPSIEAQATADLDLAEVRFFYPPADTMGLAGRARGNITVAGDGSAEDLAAPGALALDGEIELQGASYQTPSMTVGVHGTDGRLSLSGTTATLEQLDGKMGASDFRIRGKIDNVLALDPRSTSTGRATADVVLESTLLDLDEMRPAEAEPGSEGDAALGAEGDAALGAEGDAALGAEGDAALGAEGDAALGAEGDAALGAEGAAHPGRRLPPIPPLDATVTMRADRVIVNDTSIRNVDTALSLQGGIMTVDRFAARAFGGDLTLSGTLDARNPAAPIFDMKTEATDCDAGELLRYNETLARFSPVASYLTGSISASADLTGALDDTLGLVPTSLLSVGGVRLAEATLREHPIQNELASFLDAPGLTDLNVVDLFQPFRIENGRMTFDGLTLDGGDVKVMGGGWTGLDGAYEMDLDLWLPQEWAGKIREVIPGEVANILFGADVEQILVAVKVSGQRDGLPSIQLDESRIREQAEAHVRAEIEDKRDELLEDATEQAIEAAKDLLGADSTATESVQDAVEGVIKGLFGKD